MLTVLVPMLYVLARYTYEAYQLWFERDDVAEPADERDVLPMQMYIDALQTAEYPRPVGWYKPRLIFSPPMYLQRYYAVSDVLKDPKYKGQLRKVVDFGCCELAFVHHLQYVKDLEEILCVDVDRRILEANMEKAKPFYTLDFEIPSHPLVIKICEGSVTHNDKMLENTDAVICIELIEHLYPDTLMDFPFNIFGYIKPKVVVITTPNADFNVLFRHFSGYRHPDHKFEWTREQFQDWAQNIVVRYPEYSVTFHGIYNGPEGTEDLGACTQMAVFHRRDGEYEKCNEASGVHGLFNILETYKYPFNRDNRTDEEKVLIEVTAQIRTLSESCPKVIRTLLLRDIIWRMSNKYKPITERALKSILEEAGWTVKDGKYGLVLLIPEPSSSSSSIEEESLDNIYSIYQENKGNFDSELYINTISTTEEYVLLPNPYHEDWNEDLSIIIPQDYSSTQENTYLFDGENPVVEEHDTICEDRATSSRDSSKRLWANDTIESSSIKQESLDMLISPILNKGEINNIPRTADSSTSSVLNSSIIFSRSSSNSGELRDTTNNTSVDMMQPALLQNEHITLKTMQEVTQQLDFRPYLSMSVSSTSPDPFLFNCSELQDSLQDYSIITDHQIESYKQFGLNAFHQSDITYKADINIEESKDIFKIYEEVPPKRDETQRVERNNLECSSYLKMENSCNVVQDNVTSIRRNYPLEDSDVAETTSLKTSSSISSRQPKFTSSPKVHAKVSITKIARQSSLECKEPMPAINSNNTIETIEKVVLDVDNSLLENNQECSSSYDNTIKETTQLCTTTSSNYVTHTLKYDAEFATSNNIQQKLCLHNNSASSLTNHFASEKVKSLQHAGEALIRKEDTNNHETDVINDIQYTDASDKSLLSNENIKHEDVYSTLVTASKMNDVNIKSCLKDVISNPTQPNIRGKSSNSHRELLSSKSHNNSKYSSFERAKETTILENDRFVSRKANEDTNNIQSTSVLKSEEEVRFDIKGPINKDKDINISHITDSMDYVEAKALSPIETPNSCSPEIMDSGYPNSTSAQDITPEYDLSSIAQDHIPESESPSIAEAPRFGILEPIEVENGDLANNNRDDEGNNMMAADVNDLEDLQPFIDVLENDLENENDIYVLQNGFPLWLLRILNMVNPLEFDMQVGQNQRIPDEVADDANYMGRDEGFDSSSSEDDSYIGYNEIENDNKNK